MQVLEDCKPYAEHLPQFVEGKLPAGEAAHLRDHLRGCPDCRAFVEQIRQVSGLVQGVISPSALRADFHEETGRRLHAIHSRQAGPLENEDEELEFQKAAPITFLDRLQTQFGAAPWWMISGAFHALLIMLFTLITMALLMHQKDDVVIVSDLAKQKEPEKIEEPEKREMFEKPVPVEVQEVETEQMPIVTHEEVEVSDHVETPDDSDAADTRGEDGISDVMLGGSGTVAALGLGGGGGGAFGRPGGAGGRLRRAIRGGGGQKTESALNKALEWLARNQEAAGNWDVSKHSGSYAGDTACTGLAVLAFLGAGHTEKVGKYKDNVFRAVQWLISQQDDKGFFKGGGDRRDNYGHPIAGLAIAEAAAMARIATTAQAAQKAVNYSVDIHQVKKGGPSEKMGWRYGPQEMGDTSLSGWYIMQLKSAKVAGLQVDPAAFEGAMKFLDSVEVEKVKPGEPYSGHRYGYRRDGGPIRIKSKHGNTSIGILGRLFLGVPAEEVQGGVEYFMQEGGLPRADHPEFYHWYYSTLCTFQMGGDIWKRWNESLKTALLTSQRKGGAEDGSWDPKGHSVEGAESQGGRVFTTAMGALCLEVYYRYLPMYR